MKYQVLLYLRSGQIFDFKCNGYDMSNLTETGEKKGLSVEDADIAFYHIDINEIVAVKIIELDK